MSLPTIYCNKKHALPGELITVVADLDIGVWDFPNALDGDIVMVSGEMDERVLTFKCLNEYDPLIVSFLSMTDMVKNGSGWADQTGNNILADYWRTSSASTTKILTGWNFDGRSQRVTQIAHGQSYITQDDLTMINGEYTVSLDYRATDNIELNVGGNTYTLLKTFESPPFPIYPIVHNYGRVNFETTDGGHIQWVLSDGSYESGTIIDKILPTGTSYLIMDNFVGESINSGGTGGSYVGSTSDLPRGLSIYESESSNIEGDISELDHITDVLSITNNEHIYGDIINLKDISSVIDLNGSVNISGDIGSLDYTDHISLSGCSVCGVVSSSAEATYWNLNNTLLTVGELGESIKNIAAYAISLDVTNGHFECYDNMPTVSDSDVCDAIYDLIYRDWDVIVHSDCGGSGT
jgi:hypothetical protein